MTNEELAALKKRVQEAENAGYIVKQLEESVAALQSGEVCQLRLQFHDDCDAPVQYYKGTASDPKWLTVCWTRSAPGIAEEVLLAVKDIVARRLEAAKKTLSEI